MRSIVATLFLIASLSAAQASDKPVALPPAQVKKVNVFTRTYEAIGGSAPAGQRLCRCGGYFTNRTPYEIASIVLEMQIFDPIGQKIVARKDVTITQPVDDRLTGFQGRLLPFGDGTAYATATFPNGLLNRPYWIVVKSATGWLKAGDLADVSHLFSAITRGQSAQVIPFLKTHPNYARLVTPQGHVSPVHIAAAHGRLDILKVLVSLGGSLSYPDTAGDQAIHFAGEGGSAAEVEYLLANGIPADVPSVGRAQTPFAYAVAFGNLKVADVLLKHGANINYLTRMDGVAPLTMAILSKQYGSFEFLLSHGANPNAHSEAMSFPLLAAADHGVKWVKPLLDKGANPNLEQGRGNAYTALHEAASVGDAAVVKLLLAHGADPRLADAFRKRPSDYARANGHANVVQILRAAGG
ncbi:MAG TPA: ankyrin repeat domain-containing protein [Fimbriimonadaceae bacterium]|nr:ankyrin repeat domain-containing protein [Fimbriimonadaceae bacterium]